MSDLLYEPDERPAYTLAFGISVQRAMTMAPGLVLIPTIIMRAAEQDETYLAWAIFAMLLVNAAMTVLQTLRLGCVGSADTDTDAPPRVREFRLSARHGDQQCLHRWVHQRTRCGRAIPDGDPAARVRRISVRAGHPSVLVVALHHADGDRNAPGPDCRLHHDTSHLSDANRRAGRDAVGVAPTSAAVTFAKVVVLLLRASE